MTTNKITLLLIGLLSTILLSSFLDDPDFIPSPNIKTVTEWREWADTTKYHESKKWLKSRREYFPNGQIKQLLYVEYNGDTTSLRVYKLNEDSTIENYIWYNNNLKKWMDGDTYYYNKGEKLPYMTKNQNNYYCFYTYNSNRQLIGKLLKDDKKTSFAEFEYTYDITGLMIQQIEYDFFDGQREEKRAYIYEYEKNNAGQVIKKDVFFVPHHTQESVTKTDKQGNQRTTYYGFTASTKTIMETIYYNKKGERTKKIEYDRENKPSIIWTYDYEYYK
ncbi:MAG: hypothetical protein JXR53_04945 [Bacteroidales bacterium]|nr:hypothetical protein [Bacteroidales bacterium]